MPEVVCKDRIQLAVGLEEELARDCIQWTRDFSFDLHVAFVGNPIRDAPNCAGCGVMA